MSSIAITVLLGGGFGLGVLFLLRSLRTRPVPLASIAVTLERPGLSTVDIDRIEPNDFNDMSSWQRQLSQAGVRLIKSLGFIKTDTLTEQLRVLDKSIERHAYEKVFGAVAGFMLPILMGVVIVAAGVFVNPILMLAGALVIAVAGFFYPDLPLAEKVEERRKGFRHALSAYLDLVTIILAGGGGIETALTGAADAGDGWAFAEIRAVLRRSRLTRQSPWDLFAELGDDLGIGELEELAASVALAAGDGAKVKDSLIAKADSMRSAQAAELETDAEAQSEKMILPVIILVLGMILFIGYGAVEAISSPGTEFENVTTIDQDN